MTSRSKGFALVTVLWLMVAASVLAIAAGLAARDAVNAALNRVAAANAEWRARDCIERARAAVDAALAEARSDGAELRAWRALDDEVRTSPLIVADGCEVRLKATGALVDVNTATEQQLVAVFRTSGASEPEALAERLLDWMDADDLPRLGGAEWQWYAERERVLPRNGPLGSVHELSRVAGLESLPELSRLLDVEPGRVALNSAPVSVLATVPGFTAEVVDRIAYLRQSGQHVVDLMLLASMVSQPSADSIMARHADIVRLTTANPDAWIIVAHGWAGSASNPGLTAYADARIILDVGRAIVTRRRSWQ